MVESFYAPIHIQTVSLYAVSRINIKVLQPVGNHKQHVQQMAVGDDFGSASIIELPRQLTRASKNELDIVKGMIQRQLHSLRPRPRVALLSVSTLSKAKTLFDPAKFDKDYATMCQ